MKRCSIIIHSVSGNCFIIGSYLKEALEKCNVDVRFYRVEDTDLHIWANKQETANDYYEDIMGLPVVTPEKLLKSDMIIFGCPTVFGNISAEMKTFIDSTVDMCEDHALSRMLHILQILALRGLQGLGRHDLLGTGQRHDPHSVRNPQGNALLPPARTGHCTPRGQRKPGAPVGSARRRA